MARVLVIDDDAGLRNQLRRSLLRAGYECTFIRRGADGLRRAQAGRPDIVLLGWTLPDGAGIDVCRRLRGSGDGQHIPVVLISRRRDEADRILGFQAGAADYVVKPFSMEELTLRVGAILRRFEPSGRAGSGDCGRLRIDRRARRVWVDGALIELEPHELDVLLALYDNRDRVLSREALLSRVWGRDPMRRPLARTVNAYVMQLRQKLGSAAGYLETVSGGCFRFTSPPAQPAAGEHAPGPERRRSPPAKAPTPRTSLSPD